jgi:cytoskeletal protein CcmA (bactofilin family)
MFSRSAGQPDRAGGPGYTGVRDATGAAGSSAADAAVTTTVVGRSDRFEGDLQVTDALRVLGQVDGKIRTTTLMIEEGARVHADVTADEVVIAGEYTGTLSCRQRLEVRASGRVSGRVETYRLMLHEGAAVDGEMKMLKQPGAAAEGDGRASVRDRADTPGIRETVVTASGAAAATPAGSPGAEPIG